MVSFTAILALSAAALATPVVEGVTSSIPADWTWHVFDWEAGCLGSGCYYFFNVTIPSSDQIAGVTARCNGRENGWYKKGNWFEDCQIYIGPQNNGVSAKLGERTAEDGSLPTEIIVSFKKAADTYPERNYTGSNQTIYNAGVDYKKSFDITPVNLTTIL